MIHYAIENVLQEPVSLSFKEGREFGWIFNVTKPIQITKLGFFNLLQTEVVRDVTLYKDQNNLKEFVYKLKVETGPDTMDFEDVVSEVILDIGTYAVTVKVPHGGSTYFVNSQNIEFAQDGIVFVTGIYQNVNDVGWLLTPNCHLVSFEFNTLE